MAKAQSIAQWKLLQALERGDDIWVVLFCQSEGEHIRPEYATKVQLVRNSLYVGFDLPALVADKPTVVTGAYLALRRGVTAFDHLIAIDMTGFPYSLQPGEILTFSTVRVTA